MSVLSQRKYPSALKRIQLNLGIQEFISCNGHPAQTMNLSSETQLNFDVCYSLCVWMSPTYETKIKLGPWANPRRLVGKCPEMQADVFFMLLLMNSGLVAWQNQAIKLCAARHTKSGAVFWNTSVVNDWRHTPWGWWPWTADSSRHSWSSITTSSTPNRPVWLQKSITQTYWNWRVEVVRTNANNYW